LSIKAKHCLTIKVPRGSDELDLLRAAMDAVTSSNQRRMASGDLPCCVQCGELDLVEPQEKDHQDRIVEIAGAEDVIRRGAGTCAELAAYEAAAINRRFASGKSDVYAACDIVRDARGPGRHHVIVLKSDGTIVDHAVPREGGCGC